MILEGRTDSSLESLAIVGSAFCFPSFFCNKVHDDTEVAEVRVSCVYVVTRLLPG